jgi:hypothetical protein
MIDNETRSTLFKVMALQNYPVIHEETLCDRLSYC